MEATRNPYVSMWVNHYTLKIKAGEHEGILWSMCVHACTGDRGMDSPGWAPLLAGTINWCSPGLFQQWLDPIGRPLVDGDLQGRRRGLVEL